MSRILVVVRPDGTALFQDLTDREWLVEALARSIPADGTWRVVEAGHVLQAKAEAA